MRPRLARASPGGKHHMWLIPQTGWAVWCMQHASQTSWNGYCVLPYILGPVHGTGPVQWVYYPRGSSRGWIRRIHRPGSAHGPYLSYPCFKVCLQFVLSHYKVKTIIVSKIKPILTLHPNFHKKKIHCSLKLPMPSCKRTFFGELWYPNDFDLWFGKKNPKQNKKSGLYQFMKSLLTLLVNSKGKYRQWY